MHSVKEDTSDGPSPAASGSRNSYAHLLKPDLSHLSPRPSFLENGFLQNHPYYGLKFGSPFQLQFQLQTHVSSNVGLVPLKLAGNLTEPLSWYTALPPAVHERIQATGFGPLISMLSVHGLRTDREALSAIVERWMDSTHTFHFSHGEMTITPLDFCAITGMPFRGEHISFDSVFKFPTRSEVLLDALLGFKPGLGKLHRKFLENFWASKIAANPELSPLEIEQCARCYILFLLSSTLFTTSSSSCYWQLLPVLADLDRLPRFNWGAAGLAHLYRGLDSCCRGVSGKGQTRLKGFGLVVLVWAYEYGLLKSPRIYPLSPGFPRIKAWIYSFGLQIPGASRVGPKIHSVIICPFDQLIKFPWTLQGNWSESMAYADTLTDRRILMEGPESRAWYLGERIRGWTLGPTGRSIPPPPPLSMFWTSTISDGSAEIKALDEGVVYESVEGDYTGFLSQLLPSDQTEIGPKMKGRKRGLDVGSTSTDRSTQVLPGSAPSSTVSGPVSDDFTARPFDSPEPVVDASGSSSLPPDVVFGTIETLDRHLTYRTSNNARMSTTLQAVSIDPIYNPANTSHVTRAQADEMFRLYHAMRDFWIEDHVHMLLDVQRLASERAEATSQLSLVTQKCDTLQVENTALQADIAGLRAELRRAKAQLDDDDDDDDDDDVCDEDDEPGEGFGHN